MRAFIRTFGCSLNQHDGEVLKGILATNGYEITERIEEADVIIVNTCAVKQPTENKVMNFIKKVDSNKLIVTGCLPLINLERLRSESKANVILGPSPGRKIIRALEELEAKRSFIDLNPEMPGLQEPKLRRNPIVEIIPISYGCLGDCSYCCVRFARGKLRSYKPEEIVDRVKEVVSQGIKEIWLTSQDTGAYGLDINSNLPSLLSKILEFDGDFYLRIGMMNPENLMRFFEDFKRVFKDKRVFKFLHIPIQSGDNKVLKLMNRRYVVEEVENLIENLRRDFQFLSLETDIICGFPGEGEDEFENTIKLIERIEPDVVNISRFFPRPRTRASKMKLMNSRIIKERSRILSELCREIALKRNERWLGWEGEIIVDEFGKNNTLVGRNFAYKPIVLKDFGKLMINLGDKLNVKVVEARATYLIGIVN